MLIGNSGDLFSATIEELLQMPSSILPGRKPEHIERSPAHRRPEGYFSPTARAQKQKWRR